MAAPPLEYSRKGYPKLAMLMGEFPNVAIFRRFGALTMLNLMRVQAELVEIEEKLRIRQLQDDLANKEYSTIFSTLNNSTMSRDSDTDHPNQISLLELSQKKLIEYHNLLCTAAQVTQLRKPEDRRFRFLENWLRQAKGGANLIDGTELVRTWDEDVKRDLVVLTSEDEEDTLSAWFTPRLVSAYHYIFQSLHKPVSTEGGEVYDYEDSKFVESVTWVLTLLATIVASLLPSLIILWLFHVKRTIVRIWITIGCTVGVGVFLRLLTNASMKEIFGGTAAFAAVEVVFIGSANGTYAGS